MAGCNGFDNDLDQVPAYQNSIALVQLPDNTTVLASISPEGTYILPYPADSISSIALHKNLLYVALPQAGQVRCYSLPGHSLRNTYNVPGASTVLVGEKGVLALGTGGNALYIYHKKEKTESLTLVLHAYGPGVYAAGRFYVTGRSFAVPYLEIVNETSLSSESTQLMTFATIQAELDNFYRPSLLLKNGSQHYLQRVDPNSRLLAEPEAVDYHQMALSSLVRRPYEREYTGRLLLTDNKLNTPLPNDTLSSLALDTWSSLLLYTSRDSMFLYDLNSLSYRSRSPMPGSIRQAVHYYRY